MDLLEPALARVTRLETAAADALAPAEEVRVDGWRLRYNHGVSRRGNSVLPEFRGRRPFAAKLREVEAFYRDRALPPRFQIGPVARPSDLDDRLDRRGWRFEPGARVMWIGLGADVPSVASDGSGGRDAGGRGRGRAGSGRGPDLAVTDAADDGFRAVQDAVVPRSGAWAAARGDALREAGLRPWYLVARSDDGKPLAAGLAVFDPGAGVLGLFGLATVPEARGRGLGARLVTHALARGRTAGAEGAYLQVGVRNVAAERLYRRIGFSGHHLYGYRVAPERPGDDAP